MSFLFDPFFDADELLDALDRIECKLDDLHARLPPFGNELDHSAGPFPPQSEPEVLPGDPIDPYSAELPWDVLGGRRRYRKRTKNRTRPKSGSKKGRRSTQAQRRR
jgi:hypothetical protein